jgi:uncharacterized membrane protein YjjB (DUF3815 family)
VLTTAVGILAAIALLMPGFIIAELSLARSVRSSNSDLELALRALAYALIIHLLFGFWTAHLVETVGPPKEWIDHVGAISAYVSLVLLAVPAAVGVALNRYLANVEARDLPPNLFAAGLGSGQARDAFDYAYQRWRKEGVWVIVELEGHRPESPRLVGGVYGQRSAVGQTPQAHDIYLEALYTVEEDPNGVRNISDRIDPERGVYIAASQIVRIDLVPEARATLVS